MGGDPVSTLTFGLADEGTFVNDLLKGDPGASARRQKRKVQDQQRQLEAEQQKIEADYAKRKEDEKAADINAAVMERRRAIRRAGQTDYRRGTILTSPLGLIGKANTASKTILGG